MKTFIILPTFNEAQNLEPMVQALFALALDDVHIRIIDDNSQDGTGQIADRLQAQFPNQVSVMHRAGKLGLGTAYVAGFKWALEHGADCIVQMDCDFSHSPDYVPRFIGKLNKFDVVVGSRYVQGGKLDPRWSGWRYLLSWWANSVWVRTILGLQVCDATAGFKCWSRRALERIQLDNIVSNGYIFQVEMAHLSESTGLHILEWPIYFEDRRIGKSKMSVPIKIEAAWRVIELRLQRGPSKNKSARVESQREPA